MWVDVVTCDKYDECLTHLMMELTMEFVKKKPRIIKAAMIQHYERMTFGDSIYKVEAM